MVLELNASQCTKTGLYASRPLKNGAFIDGGISLDMKKVAFGSFKHIKP